ncbi:hypothetical protein D3C71_1907360 [compost metagenome]
MPSSVAWKSAPTSRTGRKYSGARIRIVSPVTRVISSLISRSPRLTATDATDNMVKKSSANDDRNATRRVFIVAERYLSLTAAILSLWLRLRPRNFSVSSPRRESTK